jgi:isopentenyl diphosphate isomerase/L-lactate dehydrogenase-like FMN-dependent dehydrogenase
VSAALRLIDEELASTMRQTGITSIAGITATSLSKRS